MSNLVKEFIDAKTNEIAMEKKREKVKLLISLGLSERVYPDKNEWTDEFSRQDNEGKYYKKVACEVSDEEYTKILELTRSIQPNMQMILRKS
jgi:hypothetical protein